MYLIGTTAVDDDNDGNTTVIQAGEIPGVVTGWQLGILGMLITGGKVNGEDLEVLANDDGFGLWLVSIPGAASDLWDYVHVINQTGPALDITMWSLVGQFATVPSRWYMDDAAHMTDTERYSWHFYTVPPADHTTFTAANPPSVAGYSDGTGGSPAGGTLDSGGLYLTESVLSVVSLGTTFKVEIAGNHPIDFFDWAVVGRSDHGGTFQAAFDSASATRTFHTTYTRWTWSSLDDMVAAEQYDIYFYKQPY